MTVPTLPALPAAYPSFAPLTAALEDLYD